MVPGHVSVASSEKGIHGAWPEIRCGACLRFYLSSRQRGPERRKAVKRVGQWVLPRMRNFISLFVNRKSGGTELAIVCPVQKSVGKVKQGQEV